MNGMARRFMTAAASLALTCSVWADESPLLKADFEEATVGGRLEPAPPGQARPVNTTDISLAAGVFAPFPGDQAVVVSPGLADSGKALRLLDVITNKSTRLDFTLHKPVTTGKVMIRLDVRIAPGITSDNAIAMQLISGSTPFGNVTFRAADKAMYATNGRQKLTEFPQAFIGPPDYPNGILSLGETMTLELSVDLDVMTYDLTLRRSSDNTELYSGKGRQLVQPASLKEAGFTAIRLNAGAPDFAEGNGGEDRWIEIDNIVVTAIP